MGFLFALGLEMIRGSVPSVMECLTQIRLRVGDGDEPLLFA